MPPARADSDAGAVFIDTAILMFAGGAPHPLRDPCRHVLELVEQGRMRAVTSAEVVQEVLHRFGASRSPHIGERMAQVALDLFAPVLPVTHAVMARCLELAPRYRHLASRDIVHVATCLEEGLGGIITPDQGFDRVAELVRLDPADRAGIDELSG